MRLTTNLGMIFLAIYLIIVAITTLSAIAIPGIIVGIVALIAAILILIGR